MHGKSFGFINLEWNDEFTVRVARKPEDVKALFEVDLEYICQKDDLLFFRKRK
jgi:hypothetical protein